MEDIGEVSQRKGRWSTWRGGAEPAGRGQGGGGRSAAATRGGAMAEVAEVQPPHGRLGRRSGGGFRSWR